jgi:hypothetical protein
LIVEGLLTTATVELWKNDQGAKAGGRWAAWLASGFGISLTLCANVGSAPEMSAFAVTVAARPPLALLLAVDLLNRALKRHRTEIEAERLAEADESADRVSDALAGDGEIAPVAPPGLVRDEHSENVVPTAEQRMWTYYRAER